MTKKHIPVGLLILSLFLAALNLRPAISSVGPLLRNIRTDLGMSASTASLLTSIPVLCMGFLSPVSAKLAARFGTERVVRWSLILVGLGTIMRLITGSAIVLLLTAFIVGLGVATMGPLLSGFIKQHFPAKVPIMIAVYTMGLSLGSALGSSFAVPLQTESQSWQFSLAAWAILAMAAVPVWWSLDHRRRGKAGISAAQQTTVLPWKNKKAWILTLHFALMSTCFYSLIAWLPQMMQGMGYSKVYAANLLTVFAIVQIPTGMLLQWLLKRFPSRLLWLLTASAMQLLGFALLFSSLPWLAAAMMGIASGTLFALGLMLPIDATSNAQEAASWAAMTQSVGYMISAAGPILIGWMDDVTHEFTFAIIGLMVITVILMVVQCLAVPVKSGGEMQPVVKHIQD